MRFADQVRKIQLPKKKTSYTELEVSGDPEGLAASFSNFKSEKEMKDVGVPRASNLYDACMRKHVIGTIFDLQEPEWVSLKGKIVYGIGNAVHKWLQNSDAVFGGGRYGFWKCAACGETRYFGAPPRRPCERCGANKDATVYLEYSMRIKKPLLVNGHPDMFFKPSHAKKVRISEIKTMGGDEYDKLVAPRVQDEWQITTYEWGCSIDPSLPIEVDTNIGYIVYVTKRTQKEVFPLKIFPIFYSSDLLKRIKAKLTLYKQGLVDYPKNIPEPVDDCVRSKFENYRAKQCVCLKECLKIH